jgi:CRISPR-associated endonuclease/helicase Cas3
VRHEAISVVFADELDAWLEPVWSSLPRWGRRAVVYAIAGHHLKFPDTVERSGTEVSVFYSHPDVSAALQAGLQRLPLANAPMLADKTYSLLTRDPRGVPRILARVERALDMETKDEREERRFKTLVAATKTTLLAADLAGSAVPSKIQVFPAWLADRLAQHLTGEGLRRVVEHRLKGARPKPFQVSVGEAKGLTTLVEAGCGSGKTAAAYLWASRHADGRRLFFCYPTTGTASEGFAGYMRDPDFDSLLIHSRAGIDYRLLGDMPQESETTAQLRRLQLEALDTWPIPAVVCTAHTVLGVMENVRRGLYAWPSIVRAAFVFDEVHAFSDRLFSYLLRFLETLQGAPVLLMTATLPPARRRAIEAVCRQRGGLAVITGPAEREKAPRYRLRRATLEEAWTAVKESLARGEKVLWVSNTVRSVMSLLDEALTAKLPVQPYHSRYRYRDRLARQRKVIDGFRPAMPPMLAIATQVAEMSLDLSADLLITEEAPVPSLIQRLGRLNRFADVPAEAKDALLVRPESQRPYDNEALAGVSEWVTRVADGTSRSQTDLAEAFVAVAQPSEQDHILPVEVCEWLDGLWQTRVAPRAVEEASQTVEVIREEDLALGSAVEYAIPMPFPPGDDWRGWAVAGRFLVAPAGTVSYDEFRGASWKS